VTCVRWYLRWHMDETYVRVAGQWMYLFRAVDSHGDTIDFYLSQTRDRRAAKTFLQKALSNAVDAERSDTPITESNRITVT
jgi:transposase-like protein